LKASASLAGISLMASAPSGVHAATRGRRYGSANLSGWKTILGDGIYAAPGEDPVTEADIRTINFSDHSELQANINRRRVMAHNITYKSVTDDNALTFLHTVAYSFRVPFLPAVGNFDLNAQTVEGGVFVWDGSGTRLDYGAAFEWILNPWMEEFGDIRTWTDWGGGQWQKVGELAPNTSWHRVTLKLDPVHRTTAMVLDGLHYPSAFSQIPRPPDWGLDTTARLQAEIISLYPGPDNPGALHKAEFKDWVWIWRHP